MNILPNNILLFKMSAKYFQVRNSSKSIKKIKGKNGKPDKIELIINVDLVILNAPRMNNKWQTFFKFQDQLQLSEEHVTDLKEVFLLFDKDQDGVLSFSELCLVVKVLGIELPGSTHFYKT